MLSLKNEEFVVEGQFIKEKSSKMFVKRTQMIQSFTLNLKVLAVKVIIFTGCCVRVMQANFSGRSH